MKLKVNRRLLVIAMISLLVSVTLTGFTYDTLKKAAEPEPTAPLAYFRYSLQKDTILNENDIVFKNTPVSLIPETAVINIGDIKNKRLIEMAAKGEPVLAGKLVERGDVRVDVTKLWTIGIDVNNISNCLGGNIKEGGEYILLYKDNTQNVKIVDKVKVANMIDAAGKTITSGEDGLIKAVNISVDSKDTMLYIAANKGVGTFDLVDAPEGYEKAKENINADDKNDVRGEEVK